MKIISKKVNYADEFNMNVMSIFTKEEGENILKYLEYAKDKDERKIELNFGTNQGLTFTLYDIKSMISSAKDITEEEVSVIKKFNLNAEIKLLEVICETIVTNLEERAGEFYAIDKVKYDEYTKDVEEFWGKAVKYKY